MPWLVDTSVLLDIYLGDPQFRQRSAACLHRHLRDGLAISGVTYVELAPAFAGNAVRQNQFLRSVGVLEVVPLIAADIQMAHSLWNDRVALKRSGHLQKRPIGDVLIEAVAHRFQGIITRNPRHFYTVPTIVP
jgi:predicted nucleic acid-binding protein